MTVGMIVVVLPVVLHLVAALLESAVQAPAGSDYSAAL